MVKFGSLEIWATGPSLAGHFAPMVIAQHCFRLVICLVRFGLRWRQARTYMRLSARFTMLLKIFIRHARDGRWFLCGGSGWCAHASLNKRSYACHFSVRWRHNHWAHRRDCIQRRRGTFCVGSEIHCYIYTHVHTCHQRSWLHRQQIQSLRC